jgi:Flp pilus assembly pilin Flp
MALWCLPPARTGYTQKLCIYLEFSYTGLAVWRTVSPSIVRGGKNVLDLLRRIWANDEGQDIAEYAVMLAVILVISVGTIKLIGANANNVFSGVASQLNVK